MTERAEDVARAASTAMKKAATASAGDITNGDVSRLTSFPPLERTGDNEDSVTCVENVVDSMAKTEIKEADATDEGGNMLSRSLTLDIARRSFSLTRFLRSGVYLATAFPSIRGSNTLPTARRVSLAAPTTNPTSQLRSRQTRRALPQCVPTGPKSRIPRGSEYPHDPVNHLTPLTTPFFARMFMLTTSPLDPSSPPSPRSTIPAGSAPRPSRACASTSRPTRTGTSTRPGTRSAKPSCSSSTRPTTRSTYTATRAGTGRAASSPVSAKSSAGPLTPCWRSIACMLAPRRETGT